MTTPDPNTADGYKKFAAKMTDEDLNFYAAAHRRCQDHLRQHTNSSPSTLTVKEVIGYYVRTAIATHRAHRDDDTKREETLSALIDKAWREITEVVAAERDPRQEVLERVARRINPEAWEIATGGVGTGKHTAAMTQSLQVAEELMQQGLLNVSDTCRHADAKRIGVDVGNVTSLAQLSELTGGSIVLEVGVSAWEYDAEEKAWVSPFFDVGLDHKELFARTPLRVLYAAGQSQYENGKGLARELRACADFADGTDRRRPDVLVPLAGFTRHRMAKALRDAADIFEQFQEKLLTRDTSTQGRAELAALPVGAVLVDHLGNVWQKHETDEPETRWVSTSPDQEQLTDAVLGANHGPFQHIFSPIQTPQAQTPAMRVPDVYTQLVDRVEVIDATGRAYISQQAREVEVHLQDELRTLKIFHQGPPIVAPQVGVDTATLTEFIEMHKGWTSQVMGDGHVSLVPAQAHDLAAKIIGLFKTNERDEAQ